MTFERVRSTVWFPTDLFARGLRRHRRLSCSASKETVQYPGEARLVPKDRFRGMFGYDIGALHRLPAVQPRRCPIDIIYIAEHDRG